MCPVGTVQLELKLGLISQIFHSHIPGVALKLEK